MIAREREIEQLRQQQQETRQAAMTLKSKYDAERGRLQQLEQSWHQNQKSLGEIQQQLSDLRQQLSQRLSRAEQVQDRRQQLQKEIGELDHGNRRILGAQRRLVGQADAGAGRSRTRFRLLCRLLFLQQFPDRFQFLQNRITLLLGQTFGRYLDRRQQSIQRLHRIGGR